MKLGAQRVFLSDSSLLQVRLGLPSFITLSVMGAVHTVDMKCPLDRTSPSYERGAGRAIAASRSFWTLVNTPFSFHQTKKMCCEDTDVKSEDGTWKI